MKAENKFYAAMRDKEATEGERRALARSFEKQGQAVEKMLETEKTLLARVVRICRLFTLSWISAHGLRFAGRLGERGSALEAASGVYEQLRQEEGA